MAVTTTQTCDRCGASRGLVGLVDVRKGGWRELDLGVAAPSGMTLCPPCQDALVAFIRAGTS